jgi:hypothetical protein
MKSWLGRIWGSHCSGYEELTVFWDITQCFLSGRKVKLSLWRRVEEWIYRFTYFWRRHWLEVSDQLQTPYALIFRLVVLWETDSDHCDALLPVEKMVTFIFLSKSGQPEMDMCRHWAVAALALSGARDGSSGAATCDGWGARYDRQHVESRLVTRHTQAIICLANKLLLVCLFGTACPSIR